jgi:hypothetical protein
VLGKSWFTCYIGYVRPASYIMLLAKRFVIPFGIQPELGYPTFGVCIHLQPVFSNLPGFRKMYVCCLSLCSTRLIVRLIILQKVFTPLNFSQLFLSNSRNWKYFKCPPKIHWTTHRHFSRLNTVSSGGKMCLTSLNKFHGLTLCAIVFNMIFE